MWARNNSNSNLKKSSKVKVSKLHTLTYVMISPRWYSSIKKFRNFQNRRAIINSIWKRKWKPVVLRRSNFLHNPIPFRLLHLKQVYLEAKPLIYKRLHLLWMKHSKKWMISEVLSYQALILTNNYSLGLELLFFRPRNLKLKWLNLKFSQQLELSLRKYSAFAVQIQKILTSLTKEHQNLQMSIGKTSVQHRLKDFSESLVPISQLLLLSASVLVFYGVLI